VIGRSRLSWSRRMIDAPKVMAGTAVDVIRDEVLRYSPVDN
jgi:hypothetical protein